MIPFNAAPASQCNLLFAVSTDEMGRKARKGQASSYLVYFQMLAVIATRRTGQLWTKPFIKLKFSSKYLLMPVPYCTFDHGR